MKVENLAEAARLQERLEAIYEERDTFLNDSSDYRAGVMDTAQVTVADGRTIFVSSDVGKTITKLVLAHLREEALGILIQLRALGVEGVEMRPLPGDNGEECACGCAGSPDAEQADAVAEAFDPIKEFLGGVFGVDPSSIKVHAVPLNLSRLG